MAELFRYAAFISYSSRDARFAKTLHRALERYGIPTSLGSFDLIGGGKKNRVYPVFRDREELSAGSLGERIEAALKASAALIVVCSPNAAASPWVQKEIEFFIALGRRDKIFAIIADDAPLIDANGSDATLASFPRAFRADALADPNALEPLAADARRQKDGFRIAWLKVVAGMIGVTPGQIIDRDRRRRRQERLLVTAGVATLSAAALLTAAAWDTRGWRSDLAALAESATSEGRLLEATPLAIAAVNGRGALISTRSDRADERLAMIGAARVEIEFGPVRNLAISRDGAKIALLRDDAEHTVAVFDLNTGARRELGAFGRLYDFALSSDGGKLAIRRDQPQRPSAIHDLRTGAVADLGPVADFRLSDNGAALVIIRGDAQSTMAVHQLQTGHVTELGNFGPLLNFLVSSNGEKLVAWRNDARKTGVVVDLKTGAKIELGMFGDLEELRLSADGAKLAIRRADPDWTVAAYDLATGAKTELGSLGVLAALELSADGAKLVAWKRGKINSAFVIDLATGTRTELGPVGQVRFSADGTRIVALPDNDQKQIGAGYDLSTLNKHEFPVDIRFRLSDLSADGRVLVGRSGGRPATVVVYDFAKGAAAELGDLGPLHSARLTPDGARFVVRRDDEFDTGAIYALNSPVWTASTPPKGARLVEAVCTANAHAITPLGAFRNPAGENAAVARHLLGRPWNPCDWRGLGAILPSATYGDGWFEGLREWLRLAQVRYFRARDWNCDETTSRATPDVRTARAEMCARFAEPPKALPK